MAPRVVKTTYPDGTTPKVCIVGAGPSGLCAAVELKRKLGLPDFVVYEMGADVGGVWLCNTYPGCQIDTSAWIYSYSFAQNPNWSKSSPDRHEMLEYFQSVARKYGIYEHTQLRTMVTSVVWNEATRVWSVTAVHMETQRESVQEFNFVILGLGPFRVPNFPPEFANFTGPVMHSAAWKPDIVLHDRIVGIVGGNQSAAQVIPAVAGVAKKTLVYMREPAYMLPKPQMKLGTVCRLVLKLFPWLLWVLRALAFMSYELGSHAVFHDGTFFKKKISLACSLWRRVVRDESLRSSLTPNHTLGFKVPAFAYRSYHRAFNRPNLAVIRSPILKGEGQTIVTADGKAERVDVLILCTGFVMDIYTFPMKVVGVGGVNVAELWRTTRPETYCGLTCHAAPNLFFLLGPNSVIPSRALFVAEIQAGFIVQALRVLMNRDALSIQVKASAQAVFVQEVLDASKTLVCMKPQRDGVTPTWAVTRSGYPLIWPKSTLAYWLRARRFDPSKFEWRFRKRNTDSTPTYFNEESVICTD